MKKIILGIVISLMIILICLIGYKTIIKKTTISALPDEIVEFYGQKQFKYDWGLKSIVCEQGGFNILEHAGEDVLIKESLAFGKFYKISPPNSSIYNYIIFPLNINTIYKDKQVICKYYTVSFGMMIPGIIANNDPYIFSLW